MEEETFKLSNGQVKFLMSKFNMSDPNEAIDLFIEALFLEGVDYDRMKHYILRMMEQELGK